MKREQEKPDYRNPPEGFQFFQLEPSKDFKADDLAILAKPEAIKHLHQRTLMRKKALKLLNTAYPCPGKYKGSEVINAETGQRVYCIGQNDLEQIIKILGGKGVKS